MKENSGQADLRPSFIRRYSLRIGAWIDDNRWKSLVLLAGAVSALVFYAVSLRAFGHLVGSFAIWRHENFGGVRQVDRAFEVYEQFRVSDSERYDRMGALSLTVYVSGTTFRDQFETMITTRNGRIRLLVLDPRWSDSRHEHHDKFARLAAAFGQEPWELAAECWHSTALLLRLRRNLGPRFEVRFLATSHPEARPPFLDLGRGYHKYSSVAPDQRFDVIVPRSVEMIGTDSPLHPAWLIKDRPNHPLVVQFTQAFETLWASATALDSALAADLTEELRGP